MAEIASDEELSRLLGGGSQSLSEPSGQPQGGLSDEQIAQQLGRSGQRQPGTGGDVGGPLLGFGQGFTTGLINLFGAPSELGQDLENLARRQLGVAEVTGKPALGRDMLKNLAVSAGIIEDVEFDNLSRAGQVGFRVGEVVGASIPFAAAPFALARGTNIAAQGAQRSTSGTGRALESVVGSARRSPTRVAAAETSATLGAAQGSALAEAALPGNDVVRMLAEGGGALVNPFGVFTSLTGRGIKNASTAVKSLFRAGREQRAAEIVQDVVLNTGGDPTHLARALEAADEFGLTLTSSQKTGSKALEGLERALARRAGKVADNLEKTRAELGEAADRNLRGFIDELIRTGDPKSLQTAAALRNRYFDDLLTRRVRNMEADVAEAQARIGTSSAANRAEASRIAGEVSSKALKEARTVESSLWRKIPQNIEVSPANLNRTFRNIRQEMPLISEEGARRAPPLSKEVGAVTAVDQNTGSLKPTKVKELLNIRSEALEGMRVAVANKEFNKARRLGQIEDSIRADLSALDLPQIDEARQFSRILNDKFTRSFGGEALARTRTGDEVIAPEELLSRAFGQGRERGARQLRELEEAVEFGEQAAVSRGVAEPGMFVGAVRNQEEAIIRDAAAQVVENGNVNPARLQAFLRQNDELLGRFPEIRREMQSLESAQRLFISTERAVRSARTKIMQKAAFARVADVEDPARAISRALTGDTPQRDYQRFAALAKRSGAGAIEGLKTSTIDAVKRNSLDDNGAFSFRKMRNALYNQRGEVMPSLTQVMRENGVMGAQEANRLKRLLDRAIEIEDTMRNPVGRGQIPEDVDPMFDLAVRIAGANIGGASAVGQASGASLVLAGAVSRQMRRMLEKVPFTRTLDILIEASEKPELMAALLRKPVSIKMREQQMQVIRSSLLQAGLIPDEEGNSEGPPFALDTITVTPNE